MVLCTFFGPARLLSPISTLAFGGNFTVNEAHSWIAACLPDVSSR